LDAEIGAVGCLSVRAFGDSAQGERPGSFEKSWMFHQTLWK
jgi:hypothetical protein